MANEGCVTWTRKPVRSVDWLREEICGRPIIVGEDGYPILMEDGKEIELEEGSKS